MLCMIQSQMCHHYPHCTISAKSNAIVPMMTMVLFKVGINIIIIRSGIGISGEIAV